MCMFPWVNAEAANPQLAAESKEKSVPMLCWEAAGAPVLLETPSIEALLAEAASQVGWA